MLITKCKEVTKQGFCKILWWKLRPQGSLLLEFIHSSGWDGGIKALIWVWLGGGGCGRLLTFSAFSMGAYLRWVLIRINTVCTLYKDWANFWKMNALQRQNSRPQQKFGRWTPRTHESPHELMHQYEAKRKQAPQSEANVCWYKYNLKKPCLLIAQDTQ